MATIADIASLLGIPASDALRSPLLAGLTWTRYVDPDLDDTVDYRSDDDVELQAGSDDRIQTVFLTRQPETPLGAGLDDLPFVWTRSDVREHLGAPERSGSRHVDPILGAHGPWDRFARAGFSIHVQFDPDHDEIARITLMRADVVP